MQCMAKKASARSEVNEHSLDLETSARNTYHPKTDSMILVLDLASLKRGSDHNEHLNEAGEQPESMPHTAQGNITWNTRVRAAVEVLCRRLSGDHSENQTTHRIGIPYSSEAWKRHSTLEGSGPVARPAYSLGFHDQRNGRTVL